MFTETDHSPATTSAQDAPVRTGEATGAGQLPPGPQAVPALPLGDPPGDPPGVFRRILIAVDSSEPSTWAMAVGARLAGQVGARVGLLHVIDVSRGFRPEFEFIPEGLMAEFRRAAEELLDRVQSALPAGVPVERIVREGDPRTGIAAAADEWGADLVVIGSHGHGAVARFLLGSTAEAAVRRAHCPVLTVGQKPTPAGTPRPAGQTPASEAAHV